MNDLLEHARQRFAETRMLGDWQRYWRLLCAESPEAMAVERQRRAEAERLTLEYDLMGSYSICWGDQWCECRVCGTLLRFPLARYRKATSR